MTGCTKEPLKLRPPPPLWLRVIGIPIAPTRAIVDLFRHFRKLQSSRSIVLWNGLFYLIIITFYALRVLSKGPLASNAILWPLATVSYWRINELIYAFYRDAMDRVEGYKPRSELRDGERIRLLMAAYAEIVLQFGIIDYAISVIGGRSSYDGVSSLWDALYYSGITVTTTGFGDIKPVSLPARLAAVYEAVTGILFIALTLATYLSPRSDEQAEASLGKPG